MVSHEKPMEGSPGGLVNVRAFIPHAVMNETFARGLLYCKCLNRGRVENNLMDGSSDADGVSGTSVVE